MAKRKQKMDPVLQAQIAKLFCEGTAPAQIPNKLELRFNEKISTTRSWGILADAANDGRFYYVPQSHDLAKTMRAQYKLDRVEVVASPLLDHLAFRTAETLISLIAEHYKGKDKVHIGFAGGGTLLGVAQALAVLLRDPEKVRDIPKTLVFHSMVAGWNVDEPETDPNSFSAVLTVQKHLTPISFRFVGLHVPGIVEADIYDRLRDWPLVREAYDAVEDLDVIVTSGGRWQCGHSAVHQLYSKYHPATRTLLDQKKCIGDLMWSPLSEEGEIDLSSNPVRMFTLMKISALHDFIKSGKHVLLALGPCSRCSEPKTELLRTVLNSPKRFANHIVCDYRTAASAMAASPTATG